MDVLSTAVRRTATADAEEGEEAVVLCRAVLWSSHASHCPASSYVPPIANVTYDQRPPPPAPTDVSPSSLSLEVHIVHYLLSHSLVKLDMPKSATVRDLMTRVGNVYNPTNTIKAR